MRRTLTSTTVTRAVVVAVQLVAFGSLAMLRTVDADEGFYLLASRLVMQGRLLYVDFMYTQMPLLPYVYGAWMSVFGFNWYSARLLSALLATLLGMLVYELALRMFKQPALAVVGVFLYATSAFALAFNTVAMTYALSTLLMFGAYCAIEPWPMRWLAPRVVASGVLFALATDTRLLLVAAAPAFILSLALRLQVGRQRGFAVAQWLLGFVVGLLPAMLFVAIDPNAFVFGNLGFHSLRNGLGLIANWTQKVAIAAELLDLRSAGGEAITYQVPLLLALNLGYLALVVRRRAPATAALFALPLLAIALLLPTPTYSQYFVVLVPFAIVNALFAIERLWANLQVQATDYLGALAGAFLVVYALVVPLVYYRYLSWLGPAVPELQQVNPRDWSLPTIRGVSAAVDRLTAPGDDVLSVWPGYVFETHARALPGMENNGWLEADGRGPAGGRPPLATRSNVQAAIAQGEPTLIVMGILTPSGYAEAALADGYAETDSSTGVRILGRNQAESRASN